MPRIHVSQLFLAAALSACSSCANLEPAGIGTKEPKIPACRPIRSAQRQTWIRQIADESPQEKMKQKEADKPALVPPLPAGSTSKTGAGSLPSASEDHAILAVPETGFTLAQLEQIAMDCNPTMRLAAAEVEKEQGHWIQSGLYPNPTLGYVQSDATQANQSHTNGMLVQQTFVTAGKLQKNRDVESFDLEERRQDVQSQRLRVLTDVKLRYFDVIGAQQQVALVEEIHDVALQSLKAAQDLFKGMQVPETDVLQAEVQVAQLELALQNARAEHEAAWRQLAVIVGRPELPMSPINEVQDSLQDFVFDEEWERLLAESPQLRATEAQVGLAHRQLIRDQVTPIPDVTVQVVGNYDRQLDYGTVNALVALPVPFFDRNQGQIYFSFQELHRSKSELERVRLVLRDQLVGSYRDYVQARNESQKLKDTVLPKLQKTLTLTIKGYQQGQLSYPAVLAVQERYRQTSLDQITALTRARQIGAQINGLQLTGGLNPAIIGTALQQSGGQRRAVQQLLDRKKQNQLNNFAPTAIE